MVWLLALKTDEPRTVAPRAREEELDLSIMLLLF
jgi:hypothetical protein